MVRCMAVVAVLAALGGCSRGPALPDRAADDPSASTTSVVNPPSSPRDLAKKCDVPMYPRAQAPDGMSRMPRRDSQGAMHYELVLTSSDPIDKVASFYAKSLNLRVTRVGQTASVIGRSPHGNDLIISVDSEGGQTVVRVHAIAYGH